MLLRAVCLVGVVTASTCRSGGFLRTCRSDPCEHFHRRSYSGRGTIVGQLLGKCDMGVCPGLRWDVTQAELRCEDVNMLDTDLAESEVLWAPTSLRWNGWDWLGRNFADFRLVDVPVLPGLVWPPINGIANISAYLYIGIRVVQVQDVPTPEFVSNIETFLQYNPSETVLLMCSVCANSSSVGDLTVSKLAGQILHVSPFGGIDSLVFTPKVEPMGVWLFTEFHKHVMQNILKFAAQYKQGEYTTFN